MSLTLRNIGLLTVFSVLSSAKLVSAQYYRPRRRASPWRIIVGAVVGKFFPCPVSSIRDSDLAWLGGVVLMLLFCLLLCLCMRRRKRRNQLAHGSTVYPAGRTGGGIFGGHNANQGHHGAPPMQQHHGGMEAGYGNGYGQGVSDIEVLGEKAMLNDPSSPLPLLQPIIKEKEVSWDDSVNRPSVVDTIDLPYTSRHYRNELELTTNETRIPKG